MQEDFVLAKRDEQFYFRDGREYPGKHSRYMMEHAGSVGKISAEQMWAFVHKITNNDLGMIHRYTNGGQISVRMKALTRRVSKKWAYILHDLIKTPCIFV